ncbi:MAG TPA: heavy metal-associated domain-containing protein [Chitinophagaceae bacterium]|jgi:copper chaperone CopZ|nr:heavy metal-associated domain-containing protein [Chitinophagaceae bacterium]
MRPIKLCLVLAAACISFEYADAQASDKTQRSIGIKTASLKVESVCAHCKGNVEKAAASVKGIKSAEWNPATRLLTVKYDVFRKEALDEVQRSIAQAGFGTEKYPASPVAESSSNACCCVSR